MTDYQIAPVTLLGAEHVTPAEVLLIDRVTGGYRHPFSEVVGITLEQMADTTVKQFYAGSRMALLALLLQDQQATPGTRWHEAWNFHMNLTDKSQALNLLWPDILGSQGPVELEKAHITLGNSLANAKLL